MYNISSAQRAILTVHSIIILFPAHLDDEVCTYGAECTIVSRGSSRCTGSSALVRVVQPCTEKSPLDRGDEQHQLAASQPGPAPRWPMLLAEHFQAHPRSASQRIETAITSLHADRPQLQLSIKAGGAPTQSWTVRWSRQKVYHINSPPLYTLLL